MDVQRSNQIAQEALARFQQQRTVQDHNHHYSHDKPPQESSPAHQQTMQFALRAPAPVTALNNKSRDEIRIFAQTTTGRLELTVRYDEHIKTLKEKIQLQINIPPEQIRLIFSGKQLDDSRTLKDYYVHNQSTLQVFSMLRGCWFITKYTTRSDEYNVMYLAICQLPFNYNNDNHPSRSLYPS